MYYYLYTEDGVSMPFIQLNENLAQLIRDTQFSFVMTSRNNIKQIKLVKSNTKVSPDNILKNIHMYDFYNFTLSSNLSTKINDTYSIEFQSSNLDDGNLYVYCPTLYIK